MLLSSNLTNLLKTRYISLLQGYDTINALTITFGVEKKFDDANNDLTKTNLFISRLMTIMMPTMMLIMNSIMLLIIWVGAHEINNGVMQVGDMMAFIQYTMQIIIFSYDINDFYNATQSHSISPENIRSIRSKHCN